MLLGDDIVIADDKVAINYKRLLARWDIPFSESKTHISSHSYEFAKNVVIDYEKNISPFPLAALLERRNSSLNAIGIILSELERKGWNLDIGPTLRDYFLKVKS